MPDHERRSPNGWSRYEEMVLSELRRLCEEVEMVELKLDEVRTKDLPQLRVDVAGELGALKVKAGIWAAVAGAIPTAIGILWLVLGGHL